MTRGSVRISQLVQNGRVLQSAGVLRDGLAFGQRTQQAAHDLAGAGFGQVVAKADVFGFGDGANFFGHMVTQNFGNLLGLVSRGA